MRTILKPAFTLFAVAALTITAQAQKFGYVDANEILMAMPERKKAETDIQAYAKQLESQLQAMSAEWEAKVADYQAKEASMTEVIKKTKQKEITDLEGRIKEFQGTAQQDLQAKEAELMKPMVEKAKAAIQEIAKELKYTYIFDSSQGVLLYFPEGDNVMPLVKKKLGITP